MGLESQEELGTCGTFIFSLWTPVKTPGEGCFNLNLDVQPTDCKSESNYFWCSSWAIGSGQNNRFGLVDPSFLGRMAVLLVQQFILSLEEPARLAHSLDNLSLYFGTDQQ